MYLSISVDGHKQVSRNLRVLARDIPQLKSFFDEGLDIVQARTAEVFAAQGLNVAKGPAWAPLSKKTLRAREKGWGYYKRTPNRPSPMRWTGALQDQVMRQTSDSGGTMVHTARSSKGFDYPLAHQRGSGNLPPRPIIDLSNPTVSALVRALQNHVYRTIGMFGRQV